MAACKRCHRLFFSMTRIEIELVMPRKRIDVPHERKHIETTMPRKNIKVMLKDDAV